MLVRCPPPISGIGSTSLQAVIPILLRNILLVRDIKNLSLPFRMMLLL